MSQPEHRCATLGTSRNRGKTLGLSRQGHWLGSVPLSLWPSPCQGVTAGILEMSCVSERGTEEVVGVPPKAFKIFKSGKHCSYLEQIIGLNGFGGQPRVAQLFSAACSPGRDPGVPGSGPSRAPCMEPASPSACVSASLFLSPSVSLMNT